MNEEWITTQQAAEISGYNLQYVRRLARNGAIVTKKWGARDWMISRSSLTEYLKVVGHGPVQKGSQQKEE